MSKILVEIPDEEYEKIKEEVTKDLRDQVTDDVIDEYLRSCSNNCMILLLKGQFNIKERYKNIKNKQVDDLTSDERVIVDIYHLLYGVRGD